MCPGRRAEGKGALRRSGVDGPGVKWKTNESLCFSPPAAEVCPICCSANARWRDISPVMLYEPHANKVAPERSPLLLRFAARTKPRVALNIIPANSAIGSRKVGSKSTGVVSLMLKRTQGILA